MTDEDLPVGKRRNFITGEIEDKAPLSLAPSPADQRKLSADQSDPRPLLEKVKDVVERDVARAIGVFAHQAETPHEDITVGPEGTQNVDVPAANTALVQAGHPVEDIKLPEVQTAVHTTDQFGDGTNAAQQSATAEPTPDVEPAPAEVNTEQVQAPTPVDEPAPIAEPQQ